MKKKLLPLFVALIIIISVPLTCFALPGDILDSELSDFGVYPFFDTPYIFIPFSTYNSEQFIIYFPSDKIQYIHYDFFHDQLINTSSSSITTVGYNQDGEAFTFRLTSFGSLEIREYYGVNLQQSRYVQFMSSAANEIYNSNFLDDSMSLYWYHFDTYQKFIICLVLVILFFTILNWWLLHKGR